MCIIKLRFTEKLYMRMLKSEIPNTCPIMIFCKPASFSRSHDGKIRNTKLRFNGNLYMHPLKSRIPNKCSKSDFL